MTDNDAEYISVEDAAERLGKSASQVRRDAGSRRINSIKQKGRIWIRVDERFKALERNPSQLFPDDVDTAPGREGVRPPLAPSTEALAVDRAVPIAEELIDEIADLRSELARLTARVRKLESRT